MNNHKITTMPRGGKRSTAWTSETAPKGKGASKHTATKVKEALGLTGWDKLCNYILTDGAEKLITEMDKLEGKDFGNSLAALIEYVKPKLNRTTHEGDKDKPITHVLRIEDARDCKPINESE